MNDNPKNNFLRFGIQTLFIFHIVSILGFISSLLLLIDQYEYFPVVLNFYEYPIYCSIIICVLTIAQYSRGVINEIKIEIDTYDLFLVLLILSIFFNSAYNYLNFNLNFDNIIILQYVALLINTISIKLYLSNFNNLNIDFKKIFFKTLVSVLYLYATIVFFYHNSFNFHTSLSTYYLELRDLFVIWVRSEVTVAKINIINLLIIPALFFSEWFRDKLLIFLTFFVILFLKIKGAMIFLALLGFRIFFGERKINNYFILILLFFLSFIIFKLLQEASYYFFSIMNNQEYEVNSYGIHNRVYFLIEEILLSSKNFLNGFGSVFPQEHTINEMGSNLTSHISLLDNLINFGFVAFAITYFFIIKISYFPNQLWKSALLFSLIIISLIGADRLIDIIPLIVLFKQLFTREKDLFTANFERK